MKKQNTFVKREREKYEEADKYTGEKQENPFHLTEGGWSCKKRIEQKGLRLRGYIVPRQKIYMHNV